MSHTLIPILPIEEVGEILRRTLPGETLNILNTLEYSSVVVKAINERRDAISKIIQNGLKKYGFEFDSDAEFQDFCKERVIRERVIREDQISSMVYSYYLDENQIICVIDETINMPALKNPWENG